MKTSSLRAGKGLLFRTVLSAEIQFEARVLPELGAKCTMLAHLCYVKETQDTWNHTYVRYV